MFAAGGDSETDELVGLDIAGELPDGLYIGGWELHRYTEDELDDYELVPAVHTRNRRAWDRTAAAGTWWLRRPAGDLLPLAGRHPTNEVVPQQIKGKLRSKMSAAGLRAVGGSPLS